MMHVNARVLENISGLSPVVVLKRETTLAEAFPSYQYGLTDWLAESADRENDRVIAEVNS